MTTTTTPETMTLHHGSHRGTWAAHTGVCLTDDLDTAENYAGVRGLVTTVSVDLSDLVVLEVGGYDRDSDMAPGDNGDALGADVLIYDDEDEYGRSHVTYRLMTPAAVAKIDAS